MIIVNELYDENKNKITASELVKYDRITNSIKNMMGDIIINLDNFDVSDIEKSLNVLDKLESSLNYLQTKYDNLKKSMDFGDDTTMSEVHKIIDDIDLKSKHIEDVLTVQVNTILSNSKKYVDTKIKEIESNYENKIKTLTSEYNKNIDEYSVTLKQKLFCNYKNAVKHSDCNYRFIPQPPEYNNSMWIGSTASLRSSYQYGGTGKDKDGSNLDLCEYESGGMKDSKWNLKNVKSNIYKMGVRTFDLEVNESMNLSIRDVNGKSVDINFGVSNAPDHTYKDWDIKTVDLRGLDDSSNFVLYSEPVPATMCDFWFCEESQYNKKYNISEDIKVVSSKSKLPMCRTSEVEYTGDIYNPIIWSNYENYHPQVNLSLNKDKTYDISFKVFISPNAKNNTFRFTLDGILLFDSVSSKLLTDLFKTHFIYECPEYKLYSFDFKNMRVNDNSVLDFYNDIAEDVNDKQIGVCDFMIRENSLILFSSTYENNFLRMDGLKENSIQREKYFSYMLLADEHNNTATNILKTTMNDEYVFKVTLILGKTLDAVDYAEIFHNDKTITLINKRKIDGGDGSKYITNITKGGNEDIDICEVSIPFIGTGKDIFKIVFKKDQDNNDEFYGIIDAYTTKTIKTQKDEISSGLSKAGKSNTDWTIDGDGITIEVNTGCLETMGNIQYFTTLEGNGETYNIQGVDNILSPSLNGFKIKLKSITGLQSDELLKTAIKNSWVISWIAIGEAAFNHFNNFSTGKWNFSKYYFKETSITAVKKSVQTFDKMRTLLDSNAVELIINDNVTKNILSSGHILDKEYRAKFGIIHYYGKLFVPNSGEYNFKVKASGLYVAINGIENAFVDYNTTQKVIKLNLVSGYNNIDLYLIDVSKNASLEITNPFKILFDITKEKYYREIFTPIEFTLCEKGKMINYANDAIEYNFKKDGYELFCPHSKQEYELAKQYLLSIGKPESMGPLGIYSPVDDGTQVASKYPLNSEFMGKLKWKVQDGSQQWWASDLTTVTEPNGDYTKNAYLNIEYNDQGDVIHYNDGHASYKYTDYLCVKRHSEDNRKTYIDILFDGSGVSYIPMRHDTKDWGDKWNFKSHNISFSNLCAETYKSNNIDSWIEMINLLDTSKNCTISLRFKVHGGSPFIISGANTSNDNILLITNTTSKIYVDSTGVVIKSGNTRDGNWHDFIFVFKDNIAYASCDDSPLVKVGENTGEVKFVFGQEQDAINSKFELKQSIYASYKDFRIFNKALTQGEIKKVCSAKSYGSQLPIPVAYYKFDDNVKDSINDFDLIWDGNALYDNGAKFTNTGMYIDNQFGLNDNVSISFWVSGNIGESNQQLFNFGDNLVEMCIDSGDINVAYGDKWKWITVCNFENKKTFIACTYSKRTGICKVYIDNKLMHSGANETSSKWGYPAGRMGIGSRYDNAEKKGSSFLTGILSELQIFDKIISSSDVDALFNNMLKNSSGVTTVNIKGKNVKCFVDNKTADGNWVCVGAAKGNTRGLWSHPDTWFSRDTDVGDPTQTNPSTSTFNAEAFINYKGNDIMLQVFENGKLLDWTVCENAWNNKSWRDVYAEVRRNHPGTKWPSYDAYDRELVITSRNTSDVNGISGGKFNSSTVSDSFYVMARDKDGDNYCYLTTLPYKAGKYIGEEADQGIGACEQGARDGETWIPSKFIDKSDTSFDFGSNSSEYGDGFNNKVCLIFIR